MNEAPAVEAAVGMSAYGTSGPGCSGRVRSTPEDFRVEERLSDAISVGERPEGCFPVYRVEKRGIDTMHMAREMSAALGARVTYCGLKDSRAVAVQYVTPASSRSSVPDLVARDRFTASLVGWVSRPLTRGSAVGNRFVIVVRDCCEGIGRRVEEAFDGARERRVPNYYGLQRFGVTGVGTHWVGKAMVRRDFRGAVELMLGGPAGPEGGPGAGGGRLPGQDMESVVQAEAARHPGEWTRALRAVPVKLRRLYVQAYQSYIFNRTLSAAMRAGEDISRYARGDNWAEVAEDGTVKSYPKSARSSPEGGATPLVQLAGYAYRDYGSRFDRHVEEVLEDEGVTPRQFFVDEMQEVSAEGGFRGPHITMTEESWKVEGRNASLSFSLARGQYATVLLREVLKTEDPAASGLI